MAHLLLFLVVTGGSVDPLDALVTFERRTHDAKWSGHVVQQGVNRQGAKVGLTMDYLVKRRGTEWYARIVKSYPSNKTDGFEAVIGATRFLFVNFEKWSDPSPAGLRAKSAPPTDKDFLIPTNFNLGPAGILPGLGMRPVSQVVREHAKSIRSEPGGFSHEVRTSRGLIRWSVDPADGRLRSLKLIQTQGDIHSIGEADHPLDGSKYGGLIGHRVDAELQEGKLNAIQELNYSDGTRLVVRFDNSYKIEPLPSDEPEFNITFKIPNGSYVTMIDEPNIDYEWRDGAVRKRYSRSFTDAPSPPLGAAPGWGSLAAAALVAALLLALLLLFMARYRRAETA